LRFAAIQHCDPSLMVGYCLVSLTSVSGLPQKNGRGLRTVMFSDAVFAQPNTLL